MPAKKKDGPAEVYVSKFALTRGIEKYKGEVTNSGEGFKFQPDWANRELFVLKPDWSTTKKAAVANAEDLRKEALANLADQLKRVGDNPARVEMIKAKQKEIKGLKF